MKINKIYILLVIAVGTLFTSCENYDNFDEPDAMLSGRVLYNGEQVGVRSNGARFELWQDGFALRTSIEVYIAQDGTYSASLFSGQYKMVRIAGAPWEAQLQDTMIVDVRGATEFDVPVTPFYAVHDASFLPQGNTLTTTFSIDQVVEASNLNSVEIFFGRTSLTDNSFNIATQAIDVAQVSLNDSNTFDVTIPDNVMEQDHVFVRIGVRSSSSNEYYFTQVQELSL